MNKRSGLVLRMVAGMYLSYLGIAIFSQAVKDKPSDYVMKAVISVIFLGVGVWYMIRNIRALYRLTMGDPSDRKKEEGQSENSEKKEFAKPQHDKTKFRTAPMPVIQEDIVKNMEQTDLHAANKQEEEKSQETEEKTPEKVGNPEENESEELTEEKTVEKKPVENSENESVESDKQEDKQSDKKEYKQECEEEYKEEIEEIENDYEEK